MSLRSPLSVRGDGIELAIKASPRAGRTAIDGVVVDAAGVAWLAVKLAAPASRWSCQRGSAGGLWPRAWASLRRPAAIVAGPGSRWKRVRVDGDPEALAVRAAGLARAPGGD